MQVETGWDNQVIPTYSFPINFMDYLVGMMLRIEKMFLVLSNEVKRRFSIDSKTENFKRRKFEYIDKDEFYKSEKI
jgi:hypothetical protein